MSALEFAVFNGNDSSASFDACSALAIVGIELAAEPFPAAWCTGVIIEGGVVLTAAHCIVGERGDSGAGGGDGGPSGAGVDGGRTPLEPSIARALIGPSLWTPQTTLLNTGGFVSAALDVALLEFPAEAIERIAPATLVNEPLDDLLVGQELEIAGYGIDPSTFGAAGTLAFAVEEVAALENEHVVVDGNGRTGACFGDSGGPLFQSARFGMPLVLGILHNGDRDCDGRDYFTRADLIRRWMQEVMAR